MAIVDDPTATVMFGSEDRWCPTMHRLASGTVMQEMVAGIKASRAERADSRTAKAAVSGSALWASKGATMNAA